MLLLDTSTLIWWALDYPAVPRRDPFDRMLAAQAILEDLVPVSADAALDGLGVRRLW